MEENQQDSGQDQEWVFESGNDTKSEIKDNATGLFGGIWRFIVDTLSLRSDTDVEDTVQRIKDGIDFKGRNVWILMCSILIASIGLNTNSTAVIIGAMLVSPLMGPILGAGLAFGTNDWDTLIRSMKALLTMVAISLATSIVFFKLTPAGTVQSELLARTAPDLRDVLIAIFGGLAGIIAGSKKENSNVIPGVAIATALMPPLCTAGFGIATGQWKFFVGAFWLFSINCVFICLSTFIILKYLRFPVINFVDKKKRRKYKFLMYFLVLAITAPSGYTFWTTMQESQYNATVDKFLKEYDFVGNSEIFDYEVEFALDTCELVVKLANDPLSVNEQKVFKKQLNKIVPITTSLKIKQASNLRQEMMDFAKLNNTEYLYNQIQKKNGQITELEKELSKMKSDTVSMASIFRKMKINHETLTKLSYAKMLEVDDKGKVDTVITFFYKEKYSPWGTKTDVKKLRASLQEELRTKKRINVIPLD